MVTPVAVVTGVGAVVTGVPPVAVVYQLNVLPAAPVTTNGVAVAFRQYEIAAVPVGVAGVALTTTLTVAGVELHPFRRAVTL